MAFVVLAAAAAVCMARVLSPVVAQMRRGRVPHGLASGLAVLGFVAAVLAAVWMVGRSIASEFDELGPTLEQAAADIEELAVDQFGLSEATVRDLRRDVEARWQSFTDSAGDAVGARAPLVGEAAAGLLLSVVLAFFMLRDGRSFTRWCIARAPGDHDRTERMLGASWDALAGYLRGATLLGVIEAVAIGVASAAVGGGLVAPVMLITFLGAYVPFVGAIVAGLIAVLVALVTGGTVAAIVVAVVALVTQQLDNDLLAPVIYGRSLKLHPAVVILAVVISGALVGVMGTVLAVPVTAVAVAALRARHEGDAAMAGG